MQRRSFLRSHRLGTAIALAAVQGVWLAAAGCGGSGAEFGCPAINGCGGNPTGTWQLQSPESVCEYVPPLTYTVPTNAPPMNLVPPQSMVAQTPGKPPGMPKSAGDWCYSLVYEPTPPAGTTGLTVGGVLSVNLPRSPGAVGVGVNDQQNGVSPASFVLKDTHEYGIGVKTLGHNQVHFAPTCLTAYGAHPSCSDLEAQFMAMEVAMPNYQDFSCQATADLGCDCSYSYAGAAADTGSWRVAGTILYFISAQNPSQPIVATDYCVKDNGNTLVIGGRNGQSLFAENGLRTMTLARVAGQ